MRRSVILVVFAVCGVATALAFGPISARMGLRARAVQATPSANAPVIQKCICGDRSAGGENCICRDLCVRGNKWASANTVTSTSPCAGNCAGKCGDKCQGQCGDKCSGQCGDKCAGKCADKCQGACGDKCKSAGADKCPGRDNCAGQKSCGKRAA
jgi:hypothetical protein